MELDTGASVSLISEKVWRERLPKAELLKSDTLLKTYTLSAGPAIGSGEAQWAGAAVATAGSSWKGAIPMGEKLASSHTIELGPH